MDREQEEEGHPHPTRLSRLDEEAQAQRVAPQPEEDGVDGPEDRRHDGQEEARVKQESLAEIQMHQITRAARAATTEARQAGQPDEDALRQLQAGKEPTPREDRAGEERRRPDEPRD